jgi:hypothetical protein
MKTVHVRLKGNLYSFDTHCETLKEVLKRYKRSWIAEWWKE